MTLEEMRRRKKELGYSYETISKLSGIPLGTVQKVMSGATENPRQKTVEALERALSSTSGGIGTAKSAPPGRIQSYLDMMRRDDALLVREPAESYVARKDVYTIEDIYALPDGVRAELVDGQIYFMASPTRTHQKIAGEMYLTVANYIRARGGSCEVYIPPFAVFPFGDDSTYFEPDLIVVCDTEKLEERGCVGAPDWVVEVVSPSSRRMDYAIKLVKYREAGVKEYWIIHPQNRIVNVYVFGEKEDANVYTFEDAIPCSIYPDLTIRLADNL